LVGWLIYSRTSVSGQNCSFCLFIDLLFGHFYLLHTFSKTFFREHVNCVPYLYFTAKHLLRSICYGMSAMAISVLKSCIWLFYGLITCVCHGVQVCYSLRPLLPVLSIFYIYWILLFLPLHPKLLRIAVQALFDTHHRASIHLHGKDLISHRDH
jgi:hypothetical protein